MMTFLPRLPLAVLLASCAFAGSAQAACMSKRYDDVVQVPEKSRGKSYFVIVAAGDVKEFRDLGFENAECSTDMKGAPVESRYRDKVCAMADFGNEAVQEQFRRALGVLPRRLCESAEAVAGPWAGKSEG